MIGDFRNRAVFQTRALTVDEYGQESQTFSDLATVGSRFEQLSGNERQTFESGVATAENFVAIRTRYYLALDTIPNNSRVVIDGKTYELTFVDRLDNRKQYLRFVLREMR